jgi:hypothetical protein
LLLEYRYTIRGSRTILLDFPKATLISTAHTARGGRISLRDKSRRLLKTNLHPHFRRRLWCTHDAFLSKTRDSSRTSLGHSSFSPPLSLDYGDANGPSFIVALSQ